ncbi:MAG TPA: ACT domain-containing protein [Candidatus Bathyarchaeia archaeon]|nr:ACT domain-containing protein [Candidatus Bathyarchaeia archaeon]HXL50329.1 ACT domain-containing protein [Candidatus Limnocylindrales bacterium]HYU54620.1 ACT domain-containing protein [Candidatus Dormibacteraeota bacterium]HYU88456.1 ACT domain-containing protein [Candidatus Bathyarchaeia archaeon]
MWHKIEALMEGHPERLRVVRTLLENGFSLRDEGIYLNDIEVPIVRIAKSAGVDRRTVDETIRMVENSPELKTLFSNLRSAGMSLKGVAKQLGLGVVEIVVQDPHRPGILAEASQLFSELGISIRQALVDDPELAPEPKLVLIGDKAVPGEIVPRLLKIGGVTRVSVS